MLEAFIASTILFHILYSGVQVYICVPVPNFQNGGTDHPSYLIFWMFTTQATAKADINVIKDINII